MSTRTGTGWPSSHAGSPSAAGSSGSAGWCCPAVLDTPAQRLYEQFGGHSKGRGLTAEVFDVASHARQHPLYPLPAFGVGASMAFDREALLRIGGFDVALGAGTPARACEDTAAICDLMLDGGTFVYWPGAVMWHEHRREFAEVERQLDGYGSGLTAFYTRAVLRDPRRLLTLARLAPRAVRDLRGNELGPDRHDDRQLPGRAAPRVGPGDAQRPVQVPAQPSGAGPGRRPRRPIRSRRGGVSCWLASVTGSIRLVTHCIHQCTISH